MTPTDKSPRSFDLEKADEIAWEYTQPGSMIDNGNLFFALNEYQRAYLAVKQELDLLQLEMNGYQQACRVRDELREELDAARAGLKDWKQEAEMRMDIIKRERKQLADARAQIDDLKQALIEARS